MELSRQAEKQKEILYRLEHWQLLILTLLSLPTDLISFIVGVSQ